MLDIFKSISILYQSPINEVGKNSESQVLQMTLSLYDIWPSWQNENEEIENLKLTFEPCM